MSVLAHMMGMAAALGVVLPRRYVREARRREGDTTDQATIAAAEAKRARKAAKRLLQSTSPRG